MISSSITSEKQLEGSRKFGTEVENSRIALDEPHCELHSHAHTKLYHVLFSFLSLLTSLFRFLPILCSKSLHTVSIKENPLSIFGLFNWRSNILGEMEEYM